jgi:hypothetical protein
MTGFIYVVVLEIHCLFVLCNLLSKLTRSFWRDHTEMVSRFCAILQTQRQRQGENGASPTNKVPFIVNIGLLLKLKYIFHLSSLLFCTPALQLLTATIGKTVFFGSPHYFRWFTHNLWRSNKTVEYNVIFNGYPWNGENNASFLVAHPQPTNII